jgi:tripeptide aminopeptidase
MKAFERFIKYASFHTTSNEENEVCPSSEGQLELAKFLKEELISLGLSDAAVDQNGYVYASLPASCEDDCNSIGFIAHLDTSPEASGKDIKMNIVDYKGGDVLLNPEKNIWMRVKDYPYLGDYIGHHLLTSDGTTLIGADDKAGVAEIITALEIVFHPERHQIFKQIDFVRSSPPR